MKQLSMEKTLKILEKNKLSFVKSHLVTSSEQAEKIAKQLNFPVALKVISPNIIHKTDVGAVKLHLENEEQVKEAYEELIKKTKKITKGKLEGILVQKIEQGQEIIVGIKKDPQFGSIILFGLGGIFVEILKDVSLRIAPVDKNEALEMIKEIKSYKILEGSRGKQKINVEAIANIIIKISKLAEDKKIQEVDFNPIIVNEKKATIVDARIMVD